ncbi:MAG TPA: hypothetical protein VN132_12075, partial [Bdellovibrio sp.]|nr:hypothetical protein [Bdellovibrio sp.]
MSLILVLVIFALIGISAITILTMGEQKRRVSQQMNLTITAQQVKQKLMGLVLAPQSWQAIQTYNAPAFAMFPDPAVTTTTVSPPTSFPTLDLYEPNSTAPYYKTSDHNAGFDLRGNPCTSF